MINYTIQHADNGYILKTYDSEGEPHYAVYDTETNGKEAIQTMFFDLAEYLGEIGSRYDSDRLYIQVRPGDKHPDYEKKKEEAI